MCVLTNTTTTMHVCNASGGRNYDAGGGVVVLRLCKMRREFSAALCVAMMIVVAIWHGGVGGAFVATACIACNMWTYYIRGGWWAFAAKSALLCDTQHTHRDTDLCVDGGWPCVFTITTTHFIYSMMCAAGCPAVCIMWEMMMIMMMAASYRRRFVILRHLGFSWWSGSGRMAASSSSCGCPIWFNHSPIQRTVCFTQKYSNLKRDAHFARERTHRFCRTRKWKVTE